MATRGKKPQRPKKSAARADKLVSRSAVDPLSRRERQVAMLLVKRSRESGAQVELGQPTRASTAVRPGVLRAVRAAVSAFAFVELLVPKRIASEEIGDALEIIARRVHAGSPAWQVHVKVMTTFFWIFAHAAREVVKGPATQRKAGPK